MNQKVFLKAAYSGVDEYWSLGSLKSKKCSNELKVDLDFISDYRMPSEFRNVMTEISNDYMNHYLIIEAIGKYENDRISGYGHLETNKSRFLVYEVINLKMMKAK